MNIHENVSKTDQQKTGHAKAFLKVVGNTIFVMLMIIGLLLAAYILQLKILGEDSAFFRFKMFIVLSGSMSPEFEPGSVVLVEDVGAEDIAVGDILTFRPSTDSKNIVTHRVAAITLDDGIEITTKGDANNVQDPMPIRPENVIGRVFVSVPYLGYVLNFAGTSYGLYSLIILPSLALIIYEFFKILTYIRQSRKEPEEARPVIQTSEQVLTGPEALISVAPETQAVTRTVAQPVRRFSGSSDALVTFTELSAIEKELEAFQHEIHSVSIDTKKEKLMDCRNSLRLLLEEF